MTDAGVNKALVLRKTGRSDQVLDLGFELCALSFAKRKYLSDRIRPYLAVNTWFNLLLRQGIWILGLSMSLSSV